MKFFFQNPQGSLTRQLTWEEMIAEYDGKYSVFRIFSSLVIFRDVAIAIPGGNRNLNMNINVQQVILNAYIYSKNSNLYKIYC